MSFSQRDIVQETLLLLLQQEEEGKSQKGTKTIINYLLLHHRFVSFSLHISIRFQMMFENIHDFQEPPKQTKAKQKEKKTEKNLLFFNFYYVINIQ